MATLKEYVLKQLQGYNSKLKPWVEGKITTAVNGLKSALKLEDITDVEASVEEVNHLKGVTSGVQAQLNAKAPLASPEFTGTPTAPTAVSGTNTQQIATTAFVKDAVDTAVSGVKADLGSALTYKGSVPTYEELPQSGQSKGDTYNVVAAHGNTPAGTNYAWDGDKWDPLGGDIDLSAYLTSDKASQTYQPKGDYATEEDISDMLTKTEADSLYVKNSEKVDITEDEFNAMFAAA